jgi:hypothetical protein
MSDDRISKDLKQAIKNRKGIKLMNKVSSAIFGGKDKKNKKEEKDKKSKDIDTMMELIKTPEFKDRSKDASKLAKKLDKPVPGGIRGSLDVQRMKNAIESGPADPDRLFEVKPAKKNMGGKMMKQRPVTMNMGGQVDGVEDLTTEMDITE